MLKFKTSEDQLFWSSDIHAYHKNITRGVSKWDRLTLNESTRDFATPKEMTDHIIENINDKISFDSHLFLLGDLLFHNKSIDSYLELIDRFRCDNIYILCGNHCHRENLKEACELSNEVKFFGDYLEIEVDKVLVCMSHYPMESWNDRHGKSYMLHGHEHGNNRVIQRRLDVGVDNYFKLFRKYKPFSWEEIKDILK